MFKIKLETKVKLGKHHNQHFKTRVVGDERIFVIKTIPNKPYNYHTYLLGSEEPHGWSGYDDLSIDFYFDNHTWLKIEVV